MSKVKSEISDVIKSPFRAKHINILIGNSLKLYMLSYCHLKICISLQQWSDNFEGVIAPFSLRIFNKKVCTCNSFHVNKKIFKKLHTWLLPYEDLYIATEVIRIFCRSYCPFALRKFDQKGIFYHKACTCSWPVMLTGNFSELCMLA